MSEQDVRFWKQRASRLAGELKSCREHCAELSEMASLRAESAARIEAAIRLLHRVYVAGGATREQVVEIGAALGWHIGPSDPDAVLLAQTEPSA